MIDLISIGKTIIDVAEVVVEVIKETILEDENGSEAEKDNNSGK